MIYVYLFSTLKIESAVEEERRILRIEARRQLEATLDEERKAHMTEAKRLIDEAVEEEKRFLMKKLENALEDEKKLSDKKLEAALEQVTLTIREDIVNILINICYCNLL